MAAKTVPRRAELRKVPFANTGMMVTEVCGGTMTWGSFNDKEEMAHAQLDKMWAMGVNFLDTAELYPVGWNYGALTEKWMGNWLGEGRTPHATRDIPTGGRETGDGGDFGVVRASSVRGTRSYN